MKRQFLCLFIIFSSLLNAQNKTKIIPIIKYNPNDYTINIQNQFKYYTCFNYLEIANEKEQSNYYINYEGDKRNFAKEKIFCYKIPEEVLTNSDSIFILQFLDYNKYQLRYYGKIKNNSITYFKYDENTEYSLYDLIISEFSTIDKFKEKLINSYTTALNEGDNNGLYPLNEGNAINFLTKDYYLYELYAPTDTTQIIQLFINFLKKNIIISETQIAEITELLKKGNPSLPKLTKKIYYNPEHNISLLNKNYTFEIACKLSEEQYEDLITKIQIQNTIRQRYVVFVANNTPEIHYNDKGEWIYLTDKEEMNAAVKIIFGNK